MNFIENHRSTLIVVLAVLVTIVLVWGALVYNGGGKPPLPGEQGVRFSQILG